MPRSGKGGSQPKKNKQQLTPEEKAKKEEARKDYKKKWNQNKADAAREARIQELQAKYKDWREDE